jgi:hypothetical protein
MLSSKFNDMFQPHRATTRSSNFFTHTRTHTHNTVNCNIFSALKCILHIVKNVLQLHSLYKFHIFVTQLSWYSDGLWAGRPGFDSWQCKIFLFSTASRPALGHEADHSPPSSARSRMVELYVHSPMSSWQCLIN